MRENDYSKEAKDSRHCGFSSSTLHSPTQDGRGSYILDEFRKVWDESDTSESMEYAQLAINYLHIFSEF